MISFSRTKKSKAHLYRILVFHDITLSAAQLAKTRFRSYLKRSSEGRILNVEMIGKPRIFERKEDPFPRHGGVLSSRRGEFIVHLFFLFFRLSLLVSEADQS